MPTKEDKCPNCNGEGVREVPGDPEERDWDMCDECDGKGVRNNIEPPDSRGAEALDVEPITESKGCPNCPVCDVPAESYQQLDAHIKMRHGRRINEPEVIRDGTWVEPTQEPDKCPYCHVDLSRVNWELHINERCIRNKPAQDNDTEQTSEKIAQVVDNDKETTSVEQQLKEWLLKNKLQTPGVRVGMSIGGKHWLEHCLRYADTVVAPGEEAVPVRIIKASLKEVLEAIPNELSSEIEADTMPSVPDLEAIDNGKAMKPRTNEYTRLHEWVRKTWGAASRCEHCATTTAKRYEWANISGDYTKLREDWKELCSQCHRIYDSRRSHCVNGHEYTEENSRYILTNGQNQRHCKTCVRKNQKEYRDRKRGVPDDLDKIFWPHPFSGEGKPTQVTISGRSGKVFVLNWHTFNTAVETLIADRLVEELGKIPIISQTTTTQDYLIQRISEIKGGK